MMGAISAARGMTNFGLTSMSGNITGAAKSLIPAMLVPKGSGQQPPGLGARIGGTILTKADDLMGMGGKFYTPGKGYPGSMQGVARGS
jgi:hypothetical protein